MAGQGEAAFDQAASSRRLLAAYDTRLRKRRYRRRDNPAIEILGPNKAELFRRLLQGDVLRKQKLADP